MATKTISPDLFRRGEELAERLEALLPQISNEVAKLEEAILKGKKAKEAKA